MSPALAGRFLTTEPPGKPHNTFLSLQAPKGLSINTLEKACQHKEINPGGHHKIDVRGDYRLKKKKGRSKTKTYIHEKPELKL